MPVEEANFKLLLSIGLDMFGSPKFATKSFEFGGTGMEGEDFDMCINYSISKESILIYDIYYAQGTIGRTPNSVPMVFIVFSRDSWGL